MTIQLAQYISQTLRATLPWIDAVEFLGRKSVDGYTLYEGQYIGLTDKSGSYGYMRFSGEKDHEYTNTESRTSRGKWVTVRTELRLVLVADIRNCGTATSLESNIVGILSSMQFPPSSYGKVNLAVLSTSTDFERIFREETDQEEILWADHLTIIAVDFRLEYLSNNCCEVVAPSTPCTDPEPGSYTVRYETAGNIESGTVASGGSVEVVVPDPIVCEDGVVKDDEGNILAVVPSGAEVVLPDIQVTEADGSTRSEQPQQNVQCQYPVHQLRNTSGLLLQSLSSFPPGGQITAPDVTVNRDGVFYASAPAGNTVNVISSGVTPLGILYQEDPQQYEMVSFATWDSPWNVLNGIYDRVQPSNPATIQALDYTVTSAAIGYLLKHNNLWGHKYRFTGSSGGYYEPVTNTWKTVLGANSTYATECPNGRVYDHLTGKQWADRTSPFSSSWSAGLPNPATVINGESGWRIASPGDVYGVVIYDDSARMNHAFQTLLNTSVYWLGTTPTSNTTSAHTFSSTKAIATSTKTASNRVPLIWKYFA